MNSSPYTRLALSLILALAALLALCGTAFALGPGPAAAKGGLEREAMPGGPRIAEQVAVRHAEAKKRHRHRRHHRKRRHHKAKPSRGAAGAPGAAPPASPVAPLQSSNCFSSPHICGYPDPTNTGVPAGVSLQASGSLTITQPGAVVSGLQVTGTIDVLASNVTIENTRVIQNGNCGPTIACGNSAIRIDAAATGTTIRRVETASEPGDSCEHDIRNTGGTVTIEGAYLHACDSNLYAAGPTVLKDSYGIAEIAIATDHIENVYFNETSFAAIHDTLLNPVEQTAVIFGNSGDGTDVTNCANQLTVLESLLAGGGYSLYPCAHSLQAGSSSFNVQNNHFARCGTAETWDPSSGGHPCKGGPDSSGFYAHSGSFGIASDYYAGAGTWRGNVWDDNLGRVCINGSSSGCE